MKTNYLLVTLLIAWASNNTRAQFWTPVSENTLQVQGLSPTAPPTKYHLVQADTLELLPILRNAPAETFPQQHPSHHLLQLPYPDGSLHSFRILNSPIMEEGLQAKYPDILTFKGYGVDNPHEMMRLSWTPYTGLHALVISPQGDFLIKPYSKENKTYYVSYFQHNANLSEATPFQCLTKQQEDLGQQSLDPIQQQEPLPPGAGDKLYFFRLALSCTGEAALLLGDYLTTASVLAGMVSKINEVNTLYEKELSIRLRLVTNNDQLIYLDPNTDPFSEEKADLSLLHEENHCNTMRVIGDANFELGYLFTLATTGGRTGVGLVCNSTHKAKGLSYPSVKNIKHELAHMFGAEHTFNSIRGDCFRQRELSSAYEPGSGTTIMSYAGGCEDDAIQIEASNYFHGFSRYQIAAFISRSDCPLRTVPTGNHPPSISSVGLLHGKTIPIMTPFVLQGTATDADGDPLTYCWEEMDLGDAGPWRTSTGTAPLFRSRPPQLSGNRTFPDLRAILAGYPGDPPLKRLDGLKGEVLPSTTRRLNFILTVRDQRGGATTAGGSLVTDWEAGPFWVTAPNHKDTWTSANTQVITWEVANTGPGTKVNCRLVRILLSTNGGYSYPFVLKSHTPNDGNEPIVVPLVISEEKWCRIRIEAEDNVFFDISDNDFTIQPARSPTGSRLQADANENTIENDFSFSLSPNPVSKWLWLRGNAYTNQGPTSLELIDLLGQVVLHHSWRDDYQTPVDVSTLLPGLYTARITSNGQLSQIKILKVNP